MARRIFPLLLVTSLCSIILIFAIWKNHQTIVPHTEAGAELAPDFTLKSLDGTPLRISDYRGKVILLDFWATWCAPCQDEIPRFVEWQSKYRDRGLQVIGLSMDDSPEPVKNFVRKFRMNYPVAIGTQDVASKYGGIFGLPVNIVIDCSGPDLELHSPAIQHQASIRRFRDR